MDIKITSPLLPLRDIVVFPSMVIPLFVGRDKSILENILLKTMYDLPSQDNIEEVIVDAGVAKGQSQPILVHSKGENKSKPNKTTAA